MPLITPDPIFRGITSAQGRRAIKPILDSPLGQSLKTFVVPCVGGFSVPEALTNSGVDPARLVLSDMTVYSSVLGYLCDQKKSVLDLKFEALSEEAQDLIADLPSDTESELAAQMLMIIKWAQMGSQREYMRWQRLEYQSQRKRTWEKYRDTLDKLRAKLSGCTYENKDCFDEVNDHRSDPSVFVWFNPPWYAGGYGKMFDPHGHYTWDAPILTEVELSQIEGFVPGLLDAEATVVVYVKAGPKFEVPEGWTKHSLEFNVSNGQRTYALINKPLDGSVMTRAKLLKPPKRLLPVYKDQEITADSVVELRPTDRVTALYYYDLFAKELGMTSGEQFSLLCIDGRVAGTVGVHCRDWRVKRKPILCDVFSLCVISERYPKLNKLLLMAVSCQDFADQIEGCYDPSLMATKLKFFQTTALSKYPESKRNRGILKLISRDKLPNGRFRLVYGAPIYQRTWAECLVEWRQKWAK